MSLGALTAAHAMPWLANLALRAQFGQEPPTLEGRGVQEHLLAMLLVSQQSQDSYNRLLSATTAYSNTGQANSIVQQEQAVFPTSCFFRSSIFLATTCYINTTQFPLTVLYPTFSPETQLLVPSPHQAPYDPAFCIAGYVCL
jgi:hypothetical protein